MVAYLQTPLLRNGYALATSTGVSSALGMLFWVLAARFYDHTAIGFNTALITLMILVGGLSELSLHTAMTRFLPRAGRMTVWYVLCSYLAVVTVAVLVGTVACFVVLPLLVPTGGAASPSANALFICAVVLWSVYLLQDGILAGLRRATWVLITNAICALAKVSLLVLLAGVLPENGVFVAWLIALGLIILPTTSLIFRSFVPANVVATPEATAPPGFTAIVRYVAGNYLGSIFTLASLHLLPIVVFLQLGPLANTHFYIPWIITNSLQLFATNMATSITVETALDETRIWHYARAGLIAVLRLLVPIVLGVVLLAEPLLAIFGPGYAQNGAGVLRLLALSSLPYTLTAVYLGLARVHNRPLAIAWVQSVVCLPAIGLSYYLLPLFGMVSVGAVYAIIQLAVAAVLALTVMRPVVFAASR